MRPLQIEAAAKAFWESFHDGDLAEESWSTEHPKIKENFRRGVAASLKTLTFNWVCDQAAATLPDGWTLDIELEHNGHNVVLRDASGEAVLFPSNHETIQDAVIDAIAHAQCVQNNGSDAPC